MRPREIRLAPLAMEYLRFDDGVLIDDFKAEPPEMVGLSSSSKQMLVFLVGSDGG
jgi:hypothetical protein